MSRKRNRNKRGIVGEQPYWGLYGIYIVVLLLLMFCLGNAIAIWCEVSSTVGFMGSLILAIPVIGAAFCIERGKVRGFSLGLNISMWVVFIIASLIVSVILPIYFFNVSDRDSSLKTLKESEYTAAVNLIQDFNRAVSTASDHCDRQKGNHGTGFQDNTITIPSVGNLQSHLQSVKNNKLLLGSILNPLRDDYEDVQSKVENKLRKINLDNVDECSISFDLTKDKYTMTTKKPCNTLGCVLGEVPFIALLIFLALFCLLLLPFMTARPFIRP